MSRLGGMGQFGSIRIASNVSQFAMLSGFVDKIVTDACDDELEKSAAELADKMRSMLIRSQCGLAANTTFTQRLKSGTIPLVDSGQLSSSITYKMFDERQIDLPNTQTNRFSAAFIGIMRDAPAKVGGSLIGSQTPVSLYTVAKNQVKGYTVIMPGSKVAKKVPARDFRRKPYAEFKPEYLERMKDGISRGFGKMV